MVNNLKKFFEKTLKNVKKCANSAKNLQKNRKRVQKVQKYSFLLITTSFMAWIKNRFFSHSSFFCWASRPTYLD